MNRTLLITLSALLLLAGCARKPMHVQQIETQLLPVDSTLDVVQDSAYLAYLQPLTEQMQQQLSLPLGTATRPMAVAKPESELLNWAADALYDMAVELSGQAVDLAIVNAGGLRCDWPAGDITFRHVFELMPFDNELVLLYLSGEDIILLAQNCVEQGGQGVSRQMRVIGEAGQLADVTVQGKTVDPAATYTVATSDYLSGGADGLTALTHFSNRIMTGKKIRDLYIDYINQVKIVESAIDGRMQIVD